MPRGPQAGGPAGEGKAEGAMSGGGDEERNPRLEPLARRLNGSLKRRWRSPRLTPVHHLEAASAKEESLLLLMGLSRLPGSRQFLPQADATLELRLREGDGRGKTFEETPVEITVRVIRGDTTATIVHCRCHGGRVRPGGQRDLAKTGRLAAPGPAGCGGRLARRTGWPAAGRPRRSFTRHARPRARGTAESQQAIHDRLAHVEAAVKLDPTLEDAAGEHLWTLRDACTLVRHSTARARTTELAESILRMPCGTSTASARRPSIAMWPTTPVAWPSTPSWGASTCRAIWH